MITYFYYYLPLKRFVALNVKEKIPLHKNALCQVWLKLAQWFWKRRYFKRLTMYFNNFLCYLPIEEDVDALCHVWLKFIQWFWRTRNFFKSSLPKMLYVKFFWSWRASESYQVFQKFRFYPSPLSKWLVPLFV